MTSSRYVFELWEELCSGRDDEGCSARVDVTSRIVELRFEGGQGIRRCNKFVGQLPKLMFGVFSVAEKRTTAENMSTL